MVAVVRIILTRSSSMEEEIGKRQEVLQKQMWILTYLYLHVHLTHSMAEHYYGPPPREETGETFSNYKEHTN